MRLHKFSDVDAFVALALDLPGAEAASGPVRWARKVLQGGAKDLARSQTYTYAVLQMHRSGASAGISAEAPVRAEAVAAFVAEAAALVADRVYLPDAAKGVSDQDLAPLRGGDPRMGARLGDFGAVCDGLTAAAAADAAVGLGRPHGRHRGLFGHRRGLGPSRGRARRPGGGRSQRRGLARIPRRTRPGRTGRGLVRSRRQGADGPGRRRRPRQARGPLGPAGRHRVRRLEDGSSAPRCGRGPAMPGFGAVRPLGLHIQGAGRVPPPGHRSRARFRGSGRIDNRRLERPRRQ